MFGEVIMRSFFTALALICSAFVATSEILIVIILIKRVGSRPRNKRVQAY